MVGAEARAVVALEIFVELNVIAPERVLLKFLLAPVYGPLPVLPFQEDAAEAPRDFLSDLIKVFLLAGPRRALDCKVISVIRVVLKQRSDDQCIDRHPDRSAPIGVAAK